MGEKVMIADELKVIDYLAAMDSFVVGRLLKTSIETSNSITVGAEIACLARRGYYELINSVFVDYLKSGNSIKLSDGFAAELSNNFYSIRKGSPVLGYIAKSINRRRDKKSGGDVYDKNTLNEDLLEYERSRNARIQIVPKNILA
jgi:hypothetical protein